MKNKHTINIMKYEKRGALQQTYSPLQNLICEGEVGAFTTKNLEYKLTSYLNIDTQLSYDNSINLILNNNESNPRIINTQFRVLNNYTYEYLVRNQGVATNLYSDSNLASTTDLFLRTNSFPKIDLINVDSGGLLMGGNYVFYLKYCDADFNETEVVSESGIISIFHGNEPSGINGILVDERTTKSINLQINNLDPAFNKFFLYFTRETSDTNGVLITKYYKLTKPYDNIVNNCVITINGYETVQEISLDELNIQYNYFTGAKTQAIIQNMLFLGNLQTAEKNYPELQQLSYQIQTTLKQKEGSIGYLKYDYSVDILTPRTEYYDPKNIYYYLGYWPNEYYQLGICYILNDGTTTPAFSLYGRNLKLNHSYKLNVDNKIFEPNKLLNSNTLENTGGVFKLDNVDVINHQTKSINPLYFEFTLSPTLLNKLKTLNVHGYFFVRTKRIPTSLFQAFSLGVDTVSGLPMPYLSVLFKNKNKYVIESFLTSYNEANEKLNKEYITSRILNNNFDEHIRTLENSKYSALLSLDPIVDYQLRSLLSWNDYVVESKYKCKLESNSGSRLYNISSYDKFDDTHKTKLAFIDENTPSFWIDGKYFSTRAGNAESTNEFSFIGNEDLNYRYVDNITRGVYSPIIACNNKLYDSTIYTVKVNIENEEGWVKSLLNNVSQYYSITDRYTLQEQNDNPVVINAYRGDCFTNTVTIRLNRNFLDPNLPSNDKIIDTHTWRENFGGVNTTSKVTSTDKNKDADFSWDNINLGDLNSVHMGQWITFKCLSNYNLGLRSIDKRDVTTMGRIGAQGSSFYPISGFNLKSSGKMPESQVLNDGYNITLSRKSYNKWDAIPYENWNYENRIAFSNVASTKMFTNGFRVFQGLAYQDVDRSFGSIVKLFPYGQNLLCVFEHGLAVVPVNEKALLSTQEGLSIHLYGAGVLQEQVSIISPDYGSTWMESLIKTPDAYYGVDTSAKKIWKFNNTEGFQCISDFKIQSFLNDNLQIDFSDKFYLGVSNVRTHYNNFKGDVIFTFYNNDKTFSLCYNERLKTWTSRYSWMPLLSENINNNFYSFDKNVISKYASVWKQTEKQNGIICPRPFYKDDSDENLDIPLIFKGLLEKQVRIKLKKLYIDEKEYIENDNFLPIVYESDICGIYYKPIKDLNIEGGSINKYIEDFKLMGALLKAPEHTTSSSEKWRKIVIQDGTVALENIDYENNIPLNNIYVSDEKTVGNNECISSVQVIIKGAAFEDEEGNIAYEDDELYSAYLYYKNNSAYLHIPPAIFNSGDIKVELEAVYNETVIETYLLTVSNKSSESMYLYSHSTTSDVTRWYGVDHPFEYEFVVNQPSGYHKIFNNLMIISNNVEPESLEVEIVGDVYEFKDQFIPQTEENIKYKFSNIILPGNKTYYTKLQLDKVINENRLVMHQDCLNIKKFGRRLGNISYIEGKWYIVLQPIYYSQIDTQNKEILKTTRLRDKWAKIRIKYSGTDLAIITAIQTLMNISYV